MLKRVARTKPVRDPLDLQVKESFIEFVPGRHRHVSRRWHFRNLHGHRNRHSVLKSQCRGRKDQFNELQVLVKLKSSIHTFFRDDQSVCQVLLVSLVTSWSNKNAIFVRTFFSFNVRLGKFAFLSVGRQCAWLVSVRCRRLLSYSYCLQCTIASISYSV